MRYNALVAPPSLMPIIEQICSKNFSTRPFQISHLDHLVLTVQDLDKTVEFYTKVLGMEATTFRSPNSERLKAAGTYDPTAPCIQPDLSPSDYYLFPQLKKYLKGHHYDNDEEVIAAVRRWWRGQSSEFFADGVRQLVKCWRLCVDRDGDYVENRLLSL
ncbi:histone-lysine N-methyltransferase SETMAR [Plakobranchus ocellatus]|uniref:Histone-lysine N-methyltransferase SETMAR n=1 Tax=Plakobranchus ocellatus TaxID=259542 RepID=A0AAV4CZ46_9GAST|nr:histone-lysine N-methyltransferase SETMAR [Plakobranchus ocellatus]